MSTEAIGGHAGTTEVVPLQAVDYFEHEAKRARFLLDFPGCTTALVAGEAHIATSHLTNRVLSMAQCSRWSPHSLCYVRRRCLK